MKTGIDATARESPRTPPAPGVARALGYYSGFVALGLVGAALGPTIPGLAEQTGSSLREISILFPARSLAYVVGSLAGGRIYDRVPGNPVLAGVLLTLAGMMALVPLAPHLWPLAAVMAVIGFGQGMIDLGGNTLLVWTYRRGAGPYLSGLHCSYGVGALLSPIVVASALTASGGIRLGYWILAACLLPVAAWTLRMPSPTPQRAAPKESVEPSEARGDRRLLAVIALFYFVYVGAESTLGGWMFSYATGLGLSDEATGAYLTSAFWGSLALGRLLLIPVATRVRPRHILLTALPSAVGAVTLILLSPHSLPLVWAGTMWAGLSMAAVFPTMLALAGRNMTITGRANSRIFAAASASSMTFPWLVGQLFEPLGPRVVPSMVLGNVAGALAIVFVVLTLAARKSGGERSLGTTA